MKDLINRVQRYLYKLWTRYFTRREVSPILHGRKKDFIFIHINKTGGTSIGKAFGLKVKQHFTAEEVIERVGRSNWDSAYKIAFVRNPWDKVASLYRYRVKTNQTEMNKETLPFKQWVKKVYVEKDPEYLDNPTMFQPHVDWMKVDGKVDIDFIGKFENISKDFKKVCENVGVDVELPHLNATRKEDYRTYYDDDTRKLIGEEFKEDIELFGYEF